MRLAGFAAAFLLGAAPAAAAPPPVGRVGFDEVERLVVFGKPLRR